MSRSRKNTSLLLVACLTVLLASCVGVLPQRLEQNGGSDGPGDTALLPQAGSEQPRDLPKSRYGNPDEYEVFGKQYQVMDSAQGYQEQGIASWYGSKFHGRKTSSGEVYDMYNMTAAHTSLPIPTFVSVRHIDTNKSIIVKVNDRGPFHTDRIIDLSYAAAAELGILEHGTAVVEVTAISRSLPAEANASSAEPSTQSVTFSEQTGPHVIQVGAFSVVGNAELMRNRVDQAMQLSTAYIVSEQDNSVHRVRFGVAATTALDEVFAHLEHFGIENYSIISD